MLADKSLASKVSDAVDAPGVMAFMRFVPEVAGTSQVFARFATSAIILTLVRLDDDTWRAWGLGPGIRSARAVLGEDRASAAEFQVGGGTALVLNWLIELAVYEPAVELIWGMLDAPLRLAMAQSWLLGSGHADDPGRDAIAEALSAADGLHPLFAAMYTWLLGHFRQVYSDIDGKPCLSNVTEAVSVDMELIAVASEDQVRVHSAEMGVPMHSFITRHVGDDEWVIAANARRLPVPGWPPPERTLEGLLVDGN